MLETYRSEIENNLTEEGKVRLAAPDNTGFAVIAYKDELAKAPKGTLEAILQAHRSVKLIFKTPYTVPVRGDSRYAMIASILLQSTDITSLRNELGLKALYSEGRPLRYTFAAVHNIADTNDNSAILKRMRKSEALKPWMSLA